MRIYLFLLLVFYIYTINGDRFDDYLKAQGKDYPDPKEKELRRSIYNKAIKKIDDHNLQFKAGKVSYKMGENKFTDMTYEEVINKFTGRRKPSKVPKNNANIVTALNAPVSLDWRASGLVTSVKDQGSCGSCWAFSVIGALEGQYAKKYKKLRTFSEKQLLDCNYNLSSGNWGCDGGFEEIAFDYVKLKGIMNTTTYPYTSNRTTCKYNSTKVAGKFNKFVAVPVNETALLQAVANFGPISIAIFVNNDFLNYASGIKKLAI